MGYYTSFTKEEFLQTLKEYNPAAVIIEGIAGNEIIYDIHRSPSLFMRIYSSISIKDGVARGIGSDAIRLIVFWKDRVIIPKQRRVYRTLNWKKNLHALMNEIAAVVDNEYRLPVAGDHLLVLREGRFGSFWGCIDYPECRYTEKDI